MYIGQKCCMPTCITADSCNCGVRDTCRNHGVEFIVLKIVFYEISIMLGIKFTTTKNQECFRGSDANLKFNTLPLPNKIGLLTRCTFRVLNFQYVLWIVHYRVLTQAVNQNCTLICEHFENIGYRNGQPRLAGLTKFRRNYESKCVLLVLQQNKIDRKIRIHDFFFYLNGLDQLKRINVFDVSGCVVVRICSKC